ncbi:hypothetical protein PQJ75_28785 [Rhodoplanes sp. TEM]|uniref:AMP-dependent synthetase/ligase domain-containing protein n=1 Tax=Rhodoplanes tepidamans TaxID=200616 RepID=A0ABT5JJW7_RHOTP|nr:MULTISPECIES: hypothetical protein [Rhodoplanes]MDC7789604.1 hypothetical protein [Rhodoplanes tepidamans]MDC7987749.1 hypothetical protein [Rhodoplanes sp. TEM]MDQ0354019.1 phenylacetate-coenzyme A ligase PaaK-like adenylate-forming protein [Rhodoplanes tepidamans]
MRFDFSGFPLGNRGFATAPMAFCEPAAIGAFGGLVELAMIETGNRRAREHWQKVQMQNLLAHAAQRSPFWRARLGAGRPGDAKLAALPVLSRPDVLHQVATEGALLGPRDGIAVQPHSTSGSSGTPVKFFISDMNVRYNRMRSLAQYFIEGRDPTLNRTRITSLPVAAPQGFTVEMSDTWLGDLSPMIRSGRNKHIAYFHPDLKRLRKELESDPIGYMVTPPRAVETLLGEMTPETLKRAGTAMIVTLAEPVDPALRREFEAVGIPIRATYSSEEVGPIGMECPHRPGHYHVASSNVIVEIGRDGAVEVDGARLGRVLVTHLHSYATPFVRYDVGDVAQLADRCPCGHDGPTLSHIHGRGKGLVKRPDGRVQTFYMKSYELTRVAAFDEFRIRQTAPDRMVVEIARAAPLTPAESDGLRAVVARHAGESIAVEVRSVPTIDWGEDTKRLGYRSEVL